MLKLALIGKDVSKSDSAKMHRFTLQGMGPGCTYDLLSVPKEEFDGAARRLLAEYDAFNVTIPYKLDIIPYLSRTEGDAAVFGAVNTVVGGVGYNTDGAGFMLMLENEGIAVRDARVLVLGEVGPNFAAGMTGGFAYVYDERGTLAERVNAELVRLRQPTEMELAEIRALIEEHVERTASPRGIKLLYRFAAESARFVVVAPVEYERVRAVVDAAERAGASPEEALERAFETVTAQTLD